MRPVTGSAPNPNPNPGERRLDRPPSDRYLDPAPVGEAPTVTGGSRARAIAFGLLAGLAGSAATVALGGVLGVSAGLLVVAGASGWAIAAAMRFGGGASIGKGTLARLAVAIAVCALAVGQVGLWLYARSEGGVLALPDYLAQTFGLLVPVQAALMIGIAWWTAR